ncbi:hypothetical protein WDZ92_39400 [Nostoc sp. NIES-2111]
MTRTLMALALLVSPLPAAANGCSDLMALMQERAKQFEAFGRNDQKAMCGNFAGVIENGERLIAALKTNRVACSVPATVIETAEKQHANLLKAKEACARGM